MQSGGPAPAQWVLEFESGRRQRPDPLTGWAGGAETQEQVRLTFPTLEAAKAYAERAGIDAHVVPPPSRSSSSRPTPTISRSRPRPRGSGFASSSSSLTSIAQPSARFCGDEGRNVGERDAVDRDLLALDAAAVADPRPAPRRGAG